MRHCDRARLGRVHELMVAAAGTVEMPAIALEQLDQVTTLHRVYYTHYQESEPMTALRRSGQGTELRGLGRMASAEPSGRAR